MPWDPICVISLLEVNCKLRLSNQLALSLPFFLYFVFAFAADARDKKISNCGGLRTQKIKKSYKEFKMAQHHAII